MMGEMADESDLGRDRLRGLLQLRRQVEASLPHDEPVLSQFASRLLNAVTGDQDEGWLICTTRRLLFVRSDSQPDMEISFDDIASVRGQSHPPDGQVVKITLRSGGGNQFVMSRRNADIIKKAVSTGPDAPGKAR
jgi:hypothetical protein